MSREHDLAVAQIPKAGLRSMARWLGREFPAVPNSDAMLVSRRVAFIRHPLGRLESCYSMLCDIAESGMQHGSGAPVESWESFVDHVLGGARDEHWDPQTEHCGDVPTEWHRFEDIGSVHSQVWPGPFPHLNRSERRACRPYRNAELRELYAADLARWSDC